MRIQLYANTFAALGGIPVTPELKIHYENTVQSVIDNYMSQLSIDSLNEIVVSDHFVDKVKAFQREHGLPEEITDNEIGTAFGKTIKDPDTGEYTVFLNADHATALLSDVIIEACFQNNPSGKNQALERRDYVINLLAHELSHVEYGSTIDAETDLPQDNPFNKYIADLIYIMFDEYYACRRAYEVYPFSLRAGTKETILQIETKVDELVNAFFNHTVKADVFIGRFQEWIQFALNEMCYLLGEASNNKEVNELKECRIQSILNEIEKTFNELYISARNHHFVMIPSSLWKCIMQYYNQFNIDLYCDKYGIRINPIS